VKSHSEIAQWNCKLKLHTEIVHWNHTQKSHTEIAHWNCTLELHTEIAHTEIAHWNHTLKSHTEIGRVNKARTWNKTCEKIYESVQPFQNGEILFSDKSAWQLTSLKMMSDTGKCEG